MANFKAKKIKDPFEGLDSDWKDKVVDQPTEEIYKTITDVVKAELENLAAMADDMDLESLKEQVKEAAAQYKEATLTNKLKMKWALRVLSDRGEKAKKTTLPTAASVTPKVTVGPQPRTGKVPDDQIPADVRKIVEERKARATAIEAAAAATKKN